MTSFSSGFAHVFLYVYLVGQYAAPILMGVALWRSRSVPRWLAVLFAVGLEIAEQATSAGPVTVVLIMLPFAAAMVLLAVRTWQAAAQPAALAVSAAGIGTAGISTARISTARN